MLSAASACTGRRPMLKEGQYVRELLRCKRGNEQWWPSGSNMHWQIAVTSHICSHSCDAYFYA